MSSQRNVTANFNASVINTKVTISSNPPGRTITVDGVPIVAPADITWTANSVHALEVQSPQGVGTTRYAFDQWSNGGAASQTVTIPSTTVTYTASFVTQHQIAAIASPPNGGTITSNPSSTDGFYIQGAQVQLTAVPSSGFTFSGFSGDLGGPANPQTAAVSGPKTVTASFAPVAPLTSNPPQLSFTVNQGSNGTGTLQISGGALGQQVSVVVDQPWLRVNPSQGTLPLTVNVVAASSDVTTGSYSGNVAIGGTLVVPVAFQVTTPPPTAKLISNALATGLQFNAVVGGSSPANQTIGVSSSDSSPLNFDAKVTYPDNNQGWVTLSVQGGQTPGSIDVGVQPSALPRAGAFTAVVVLSASGSPDISIPLTLIYGAPPSAQIEVSLQEIKLASVGDVQTSSILVNTSGSGPFPIHVTSQTDDGNSWLIASPLSTSVANQQAAVLQVSADPAGLASGTYSGTVRIQDGSSQPASVKVIFAVNSNPGSKTLASALSALNLRIGASYTDFPAEPLDLLAYGNAPVSWSAQTDVSWIKITPASGVIQPGSTIGSPKVTFDVSQLKVGSNKGLITIKSDAVGGDLSIPVEMQKAQPGILVNRLVPVGLVLVPPFNIPEDPVYVASSPTLRLTILSNDWLKVEDRAAPGLTPGQFHSLHITVDQSKLPVGTPQPGLITVQEPNGVFAALAVLAYVPKPGGNAASEKTNAAAAAGCTPTQYIPLATSFAQNFEVNGGAATSTEIVMIDDCGNPVASGVTGGVVGNGDPQLNLRPLGDGRWKATWNPNAPNSFVPISIVAADPANGISPTTPVQAITSVTGTPTGPVLAKDQPFETEAGVRLPALAPNMQFRIRGQNFLNSDGSAPLVLIGGRPVQVVNATNTQLVVLTPADLSVNVQMQLLVARTDGASVPEPVIVAPAWPVVARSSGSRTERIVTGLGNLPPESFEIDGARVVKAIRLAPGLWRLVAERPIEGSQIRAIATNRDGSGQIQIK